MPAAPVAYVLSPASPHFMPYASIRLISLMPIPAFTPLIYPELSGRRVIIRCRWFHFSSRLSQATLAPKPQVLTIIFEESACQRRRLILRLTLRHDADDLRVRVYA